MESYQILNPNVGTIIDGLHSMLFRSGVHLPLCQTGSENAIGFCTAMNKKLFPNDFRAFNFIGGLIVQILNNLS